MEESEIVLVERNEGGMKEVKGGMEGLGGSRGSLGIPGSAGFDVLQLSRFSLPAASIFITLHKEELHHHLHQTFRRPWPSSRPGK